MSEYQTEMSSFIILQLKVNNKEKVDKHPSTDNSNNLDKESQKKKSMECSYLLRHGALLFRVPHYYFSKSEHTDTLSHSQ